MKHGVYVALTSFVEIPLVTRKMPHSQSSHKWCSNDLEFWLLENLFSSSHSHDEYLH